MKNECMPKSKAATDDESKSPWEKTPTPCLVRYKPNKNYYLRARFGGEPVRECLKTTKYSVARIKLGERLEVLRAGSAAKSGTAPVTLRDAMNLVRAQIAADPSLKSGTRTSYFEELDDMLPEWPAALPEIPLSKFTQAEAQAWWAKAAQAYAPQRANHLLMFLRRGLKMARKLGAMSKDPTEELKRMKIPRTRLTLPTIKQFRALVMSIRGQGKAHSDRSGDWVEFQAYSGLRPKEQKQVLAADLLEKRSLIRVTGGEDRTKNYEDRFVPMIPAMHDLLRRMRAEGRLPDVGIVFTNTAPRNALTNACKRLKISHQRVYDLRHLFASTCNDAGIDVATFSGWLGHKDGGALALRTYVHSRGEHEKRVAKKVVF